MKDHRQLDRVHLHPTVAGDTEEGRQVEQLMEQEEDSMQGNMPNGLLPSAMPPFRELDPAFSLLLTNPPLATMVHGTPQSSVNNATVSSQPQEDLAGDGMLAQQHGPTGDGEETNPTVSSPDPTGDDTPPGRRSRASDAPAGPHGEWLGGEGGDGGFDILSTSTREAAERSVRDACCRFPHQLQVCISVLAHRLHPWGQLVWEKAKIMVLLPYAAAEAKRLASPRRMRISSRRRLTLAPGWSATAAVGSGSRFTCLRTDECRYERLSGEQSTDLRRRKSDDEIAAEFWADIGFPTPASRVWERPSSRQIPASVSAAQMDGEKSLALPASPSRVVSQTGRDTARAAASSRVLVRPWIGPIPPPRISPSLSTGDVLKKAGLGTAAASSPARVPTPSAPVLRSSDRSPTMGPQPNPGYSYMLAMAPYMVYPAEAGGQRPFYDGVYQAGAFCPGNFLPPWMAV